MVDYCMKFFSKKQVAGIFDNPQSPLFTVVNDVLSVATIVSIIAIVLETVPALQKYNSIFLIIEWVAVILFTIEYVLRFWSTKKRSDYTLSLYGIIDLVAILPTYFGLGNFTFLKSARVIRIIRFLRLSRMTKLSKINMKDAEETLGVFGFNIALYATSITFVMLVLGVALHVFISGGDIYWSVPNGMFWAFSVFLGGLPAPIPPGSIGTTIFIITKFCGMALFGLLVGMVTKIFNQWILGAKK